MGYDAKCPVMNPPSTVSLPILMATYWIRVGNLKGWVSVLTNGGGKGFSVWMHGQAIAASGGYDYFS